MTCYVEVRCPSCDSLEVNKAGFNHHRVRRYRCVNDGCIANYFMLKYRYKAYQPGVKQQVVEMAINGSGIRDTSRVLKISKTTVLSTIKSKGSMLIQVNPNIKTLELTCDAVELDEQWSFVGNKSNQRWIWYAVDHATNTILAYVFGRRKDIIFKQLKALLEPFGIKRFYTDGWGAYERNIEKEKHEVGKRNTQKIERKNLNLRTWIKRLTRKTICFSKLEKMHDIVIGLLINKVEFGVDIHAKLQI